MTDLQATLDAIEQVAVHECGYCQRTLAPDGWSLDFCNQWCQKYWTERQAEIVRLVGYQEPCDLPQHAYNLVEEESPETTPADQWFGRRPAGTITFTVQVDTFRFEAACERATAALDRLRARMESAAEAFRGFSPDWVVVDELQGWDPIGLINTLKIDTPAVVIECAPAEPFGSDFDFEHTAAKSLPHEPPPAVMPRVPEPDWQALVDGAPRTGPERRRRAPRELRRPR